MNADEKTMGDTTPRWIYRFRHFTRARALLQEGAEAMAVRALSPLEKEGVVQRFEYTWELAWKLLKDYLEASGVVFETITPAVVLRAAVAARLIENGEVWMRSLDARNRMAHTYDAAALDQTVGEIARDYAPAMTALDSFFSAAASRADD